MRIAVLGDFHGWSKLEAFRLFLREAQPDIILQVGDFQHYEDWPVPTYFTHGNHEDWQTIAALRSGHYVRRHLHYLRDAEPVTIGGLRIAALGGVPRKGSTKDSPKFYDEAAYERMADLQNIDIVLSHDAPIHFRDGRRELTCEELRTLAQVMRPRFWFSGHHHHFDVERLPGTTLVSLGKWPHAWALLDLDEATGKIAWSRFVPADQADYDQRLERWNEIEKASRASINAMESRPGAGRQVSASRR
jgi:predicted phosphodiesterase